MVRGDIKTPKMSVNLGEIVLMFDRKAHDKVYYEANKEKIKEYSKAYRQANKEKVKAWEEANREKRKAYRKARYEANKERILAQNKAWYQANKEKRYAISAKKRASKLKRTPSWLTNEDLKEIKDIYRMAIRRQEVEGIAYHVDHIIPLQGKNISGLHVPNNLQILKARDNISKGNRYE